MEGRAAEEEGTSDSRVGNENRTLAMAATVEVGRPARVGVVLLLALWCSLAAGRNLASAGARSHGIQRRPLQVDGSAFEPCDPEDNAEDCECEVKDNQISCARVSTTDDGSSASAAAAASGSGPVSSSASVTITGSGGSANSSTSTPGGGTDASAEQSPSPTEPPPPPTETPPQTAPPKMPPPKKTPAQKPALKRPTEKPEGYEDLTERCFVEPDEEEEAFARGLVTEGVKVTLLYFVEDDLYRIDTFYEVPGTIGSSTIITTRVPDYVAVLCDIEAVERDDSVAHVSISHTSMYSSSSDDLSERRPAFSSKSTTTITSGGTTTTISSDSSSPSKGL